MSKIAIVGTAPTSKMLAPFADQSWDIWACSAGNVNQLPRINVWFELHAVAQMMSAEDRAMAEPFYAWLRQKQEEGAFEVVMLEAGSALGGKNNTFVPKAIPYPLEQMIAEFGTSNWFTSSVAYMMALAIARGATEIGLFGVDMAADQEHYEGQRAGCTYWKEVAEKRGIVVHIPMESSLAVATPLYGYWEGTPFGRRINAVQTQVKGTLGGLDQQIRGLEIQRAYFQGADEQLRYFKRTWTDGREMASDLGVIQNKLDEAKAAAEAAPAATGVFGGPMPQEAGLPAPAPAQPAVGAIPASSAILQNTFVDEGTREVLPTGLPSVGVNAGPTERKQWADQFIPAQEAAE